MLAEYQPPAMPEVTRIALNDFVAARKAAMPDEWY
jgi:trimethylamine--corrinoid protein Co-methyltransferase